MLQRAGRVLATWSRHCNTYTDEFGEGIYMGLNHESELIDRIRWENSYRKHGVCWWREAGRLEDDRAIRLTRLIQIRQSPIADRQRHLPVPGLPSPPVWSGIAISVCGVWPLNWSATTPRWKRSHTTWGTSRRDDQTRSARATKRRTNLAWTWSRFCWPIY
jgi:hypothetical protein